MEQLKLTEWFAEGVTPVHIGVYNVSCRSENQTGRWYAYWNGTCWTAWATSPFKAESYKYQGSFFHDERWSWRGVVK